MKNYRQKISGKRTKIHEEMSYVFLGIILNVILQNEKKNVVQKYKFDCQNTSGPHLGKDHHRHRICSLGLSGSVERQRHRWRKGKVVQRDRDKDRHQKYNITVIQFPRSN